MISRSNRRISTGTVVHIGGRQLVFGQHMFDMQDANDLLGNFEALRARLAEDGYLLIRGFHDKDLVRRVGLEVVEQIDKRGGLAPGTPIEDRIAAEHICSLPDGEFITLDDPTIQNMSAFGQMVSSEQMFGFVDALLDGPSRTFPHKWIRIYQPGCLTKIHFDSPFLGIGTTQGAVTAWAPLGDITLDMGPLAVVHGSHRIDQLITTYGETFVNHNGLTNLEALDWFQTVLPQLFQIMDNYGLTWRTTEFEAGDLLLFTKYLLHGSLKNHTRRYRLSTDWRFQRADEPVDPLWTLDPR